VDIWFVTSRGRVVKRGEASGKLEAVRILTGDEVEQQREKTRKFTASTGVSRW
jgi:hypothetical protein